LELEHSGTIALLVVFAASSSSIAFQRVDAGAPVSLRFDLDSVGLAGLADYLARLQVKAVELFDIADAPDALFDALLAIGAPVDLYGIDLWALRGAPAAQTGRCSSPAGSTPCRACLENHSAVTESRSWREREARIARAFAAARNVRSLDRMGSAFAHRLFGERAAETWEPPQEPASFTALAPRVDDRLGIIAPVPSLESDRIAVRLARGLTQRDGGKRIVVFGSSFAEQSLLATGTAWVAGLATPEDYPVLARQYGVGRLALFARSGFFGPLDAAARILGMRKAYFDWSFGALATEPGDLAIDPRVCDAKAAAAVAMWLNSD
jgi:hypothetical protein